MRRNSAPYRRASCALLVFVLTGGGVGAQEPLLPPGTVSVWEGSLELPVYFEGPPDPNPPFDFFRPDRINYPYTIRNNLTDERAVRGLRALFLENEYLRCSVLPDLGGHLYSCTDKLSGEELFYANESIKLSQIGYRGAWAAFGVEFNFPVSHNWMSASPVDFGLQRHADGSASIWVGNVDRVYRTDWRVQLTLRPEAAVLEQHTVLYNQSDVRHRYYWWTNAAVRVTDGSWILYPQRYSASHGFTDIDTWPVDRRGTDNSLVGNHVFGPVSRFSHGSREGFMAVYHPETETGIVHYSSPADLPSKKIWSWGRDARGLDWREALSDDNSAYVEIQAGIFRDQETYGFLEPQATVRFSEYWTPLRDLGGLSRANPDAAVHLCRVDACGQLPAPGLDARGHGALRLRLSVTREHPAATLILARGGTSVHEERLDLAPSPTYDRTFDDLTGSEPYTVTIVDGFGAELLRHTEGVYDFTPDDRVRTGAQPTWSAPGADGRTEVDFLAIGEDHERNGRRVDAWETYREGTERFPDGALVRRARGRLAAVLGRSADAIALLEPVAARVSNDTEALYYLGLALAAEDRIGEARIRLEAALTDVRFRAGALLRLAELEARNGNPSEALDHVRRAIPANPGATRAGVIEVALLRELDREGEALERADYWRGIDPSNTGLRWEAMRLGAHDPGLAVHLAADPERILSIAAQYFRLGSFAEAERLLGGSFPDVPEGLTEPGQPAPSRHPLIAYYLGFAQQALGKDPRASYERARTLPADYIFPSRPETADVLRDALAVEPDDALATALTGSLALARLEPAVAIERWRRASALDPGLPALHRNLGLLLLRTGATPGEAIDVLLQGTRHDPDNVGVYDALDAAMEADGRTASDRADALLGYPDPASMPAALVYRTVRRLIDAGRFDEADALFYDRYFPREEGGINVRRVYLEARIGRARVEADAGRCGVAMGILDRLLDVNPELEFTRVGLDVWLERSGLGETATGLRGRCGVELD